MPELTPGIEFAGHRIEGVAGRGGMGVVYRATHLALDHVVALKVISPELASDERFRERFVRESRAAVSIRHPNVVGVRHAGEEQGLLFVTMDLIDGVDLGRLLRREGALASERAIGIIVQVAAALDAAHERGLIHRDVKPGNILIEERGDGEHAYLTDFGLTKRIEASVGVTATGAFVGTIDYVAPEQIKGGRLDARTDVYALGCVLYEAIAGAPPFADRGEQVAKLYAHLQDPPPRLSEAAPPGTPAALDAVVARALEKEPDKRFQSAGALAEAAEGVLAEPAATIEAASPAATVETGGAAEPAGEVEPAPAEPRRAPHESTTALPPPKPPPSPASVRRRRALVGLVGVVVVVGVAIAVIAGGGSGGSSGTGAGKAVTAKTATSKRKTSRVFGTPIPVAGMPVGIGVGEKGIWVSSRETDRVTHLSPNGKEVATIKVGKKPNGLAAKLGAVWVTNSGDGTVTPINPKTDKAGQPIKVGSDPRAIGVAGNNLWVANTGTDTVSKITPGQGVTATVTVGNGPRGVAAGPGGIWISNGDDGTVSVIDPSSDTVTHTISLGSGTDPKGSAISAGKAWIANEGNGTVTPIDVKTYTVEAPVKVGREPRDVAVGGGDLFVSNGGSGTVTRITPASAATEGKVLRTTLFLPPGSAPENASSGLGQVWVADGGNDTVIPLTTVAPKG